MQQSCKLFKGCRGNLEWRGVWSHANYSKDAGEILNGEEFGNYS